MYTDYAAERRAARLRMLSARRSRQMEALYVDRARQDDIGVSPKYRNGRVDRSPQACAAWEARAAAWNADHDVETTPRVARKSQTKRKRTRTLTTARPARTYRAARRNAARLLRAGPNSPRRSVVA